MWVALFLVCIQNVGCEQVVETKKTYHPNQEVCEDHAIKLSKLMTHRFKELGYNAEIGYRCDLDKKVIQING
jgi:hypothetical protein